MRSESVSSAPSDVGDSPSFDLDGSPPILANARLSAVDVLMIVFVRDDGENPNEVGAARLKEETAMNVRGKPFILFLWDNSAPQREQSRGDSTVSSASFNKQLVNVDAV